PCFEYKEPQAHAKEARSRRAAPPGLTRSEPPRFFGPTRSASPANPRTNPVRTLGTGRTPPGRNQSTITIHKDTVATSRDAIPEGRVCSATQPPPLPTNRSKNPVIAAVRQCCQVGLIVVFQRRIG